MEKRYVKTMLALAIVSIASIALTGYLYDTLPSQIAIHWGLDGEIDAYADRIYAFVTASLPLLLLLLMAIIPKIDPRKESYQKHAGAYIAVVSATILFLIGMHWGSLFVSMGYPLDIVFWIRLLIGALFVLIGAVMPQIRHNYTFGLRTPWTLADESVWNELHRKGGPLFIIVGIIIAFLAFVPLHYGFHLTIGLIIMLIVSLFVYSYMLYAKKHRKEGGGHG